MPRVPVAQNAVNIASVTDAKLQPAETGAGGLGRGLQAVGAGLGQYAETLHKLDLDAQSADFATQFAQARLAVDKARTEARSTAGPGAAGYTQAMDKVIADTTAPILESIKNRGLRNRAAVQMESWKASVIGEDFGWELGKKREKSKTDLTDAIDLATARVRASPDAGAYATEKRAMDDLINSRDDLDAETLSAVRKYGDRALAGSAIGAGLDSNPEGIRDSLKRGDWNGVLDGKEIDTYMAQADVAINRINVAKEHQLSLAKAQFSERLATVNAQLAAGIKVDDATLIGLADQATAFGDTSGAFNLQDARVRANVNEETKGWTPTQWEAERNRLRSLKKPSATDQVRLDQIEKRMPSAVSEFEKDPGGFAAANGVPPPKVDFTNPNSIAARNQWRATVSRATGRPVPFFSPAEQSDLRAQAEGGPANELQVINKVAMVGGRDAVTEMQRILPNDAKAARLVTLNQFDRGTAMNGVKLLAENPALLPDKVSRPAFDQRMGTAAMLMDGSEAEGIYATARGIYVAEQRKSGKSPEDFDQGAWNGALHRALGGKYDGQNWYGGIWSWGKSQVLISPTITGKQFEGAMTKLGGATQWRKGAAPVYANGQPIPPADLARKFTPVMRPDGWYEFVDGSGNPVPAANGKAFLIDIEATARKYPK
jgi:hypothetical protein